MWSKLDDALFDHPKLWIAGERLGKNGVGLALGMYALGLMYANKHLTDGILDREVVKSFRHIDKPLAVADALAHAGLWDRIDGGFHIHDFAEYNPTASSVKKKRRDDRIRKQQARAH